MELDLIQPYRSRLRGPLSDGEKQRRRELNLCHYCASPNHRISTCSLAPPPRLPPLQMIQVAQTSDLSDVSSKDPAQE